MKLQIVLILLMTVLASCNKSEDDPLARFPECVGIVGSFNPQSITKPYSGKIWNTDTTIHTQFIFTDYVNYNLLLTAEKSWNMWIKFTSGTITTYQSSYCYYSFGDKIWYADTGFDFKGQYSSWNFKFDAFDCPSFSGKCDVIFPQIQDTLKYQFEGIK